MSSARRTSTRRSTAEIRSLARIGSSNRLSVSPSPPAAFAGDWDHRGQSVQIDVSYDPFWHAASQIDSPDGLGVCDSILTAAFNASEEQTWGRDFGLGWSPSRNRDVSGFPVRRRETGLFSWMGRSPAFAASTHGDACELMHRGDELDDEDNRNSEISSRRSQHRIRRGADLKKVVGPNLTLGKPGTSIRTSSGQRQTLLEVTLSAFETFFSETAAFFIAGAPLSLQVERPLI